MISALHLLWLLPLVYAMGIAMAALLAASEEDGYDR